MALAREVLAYFGRMFGLMLSAAGALVGLLYLVQWLGLPPADASLAGATMLVGDARLGEVNDRPVLWLRHGDHESSVYCPTIAELCERTRGRPLENLTLWVHDGGSAGELWVLQARLGDEWVLTEPGQRLVRTRLSRQWLRMAIAGLCAALVGLLLLVGLPGRKASPKR